MNRFNLSSVLTFVFLLVLFSCERKATTTSSGNNDSAVAETANQAMPDTTNQKTVDKKSNINSWIVNQQNSKIEFTIKNFGAEVHGTLEGLKGTIHFSENDPERSSFEATVPVNTINTENKKRDKDLMHPKYFDTEKYPEITYRSDTIVKSDNGYLSKGTLTIKGKSIYKGIPFTFEQKDDQGIFSSQFTLKRLDFGIGGTGPIMGEDINVSLYVVTEKH